MAGLLGIGGGLIIVPVLAFLFARDGVNPDIVMQCAIATSLATIMLTSLSSIRAHHARGAVQWSLFRRLTPGIVAGAVLGAAIADVLPSPVLRNVFAVLVLAFAAQMAFTAAGVPGKYPPPGRAILTAVGVAVGAVSALLGVGGGSIVVPYLRWRSVPMRHAVATAAAGGFPIAVAGTAGFVVAGLNEVGRPAWSAGYVALPAFAAIAAVSVLFAPVGVWLAHHLPEVALRRVFALFLAALGLRMLLS